MTVQDIHKIVQPLPMCTGKSFNAPASYVTQYTHTFPIHAHQVFGKCNIYAQCGDHIYFDKYLAVTGEVEVLVSSVLIRVWKNVGYIYAHLAC